MFIPPSPFSLHPVVFRKICDIIFVLGSLSICKIYISISTWLRWTQWIIQNSWSSCWLFFVWGEGRVKVPNETWYFNVSDMKIKSIKPWSLHKFNFDVIIKTRKWGVYLLTLFCHRHYHSLKGIWRLLLRLFSLNLYWAMPVEWGP